MICDHCGAGVSDEDTACPTCGAAVGTRTDPGPGAHDPTAGGGPSEQAPPEGDPPPPTPPPAGPPPPGAAQGGRPHPSGLPAEARNWAMGAHLSAFVGMVGIPMLVGPLVVWLLRREVDGFSERHAREALNFNLTLLLVLVVGVAATVLTLGIALLVLVPVGLALGIAWIWFTIQGAVRASEGREFTYPLTIRFVS